MDFPQGFEKFLCLLKAKWCSIFFLVIFPIASLSGQTKIMEAEYFYDQDPGIGKGNIISLVASDTLDKQVQIQTSGLTPGFHKLYLRVKDAGGVWSIAQQKSIYVKALPLADISKITNAEYFFDIDPGLGSGIPINISESDSLTIRDSLSISGVSEGFHILYLRTRNKAGVWSLSVGRSFYIDAFQTKTDNISKVEYYIDVDPGLGKGSLLPIGNTIQVDSVFSIDLSGYALGFHKLVIRAQDQIGNWSISTQKSFYVEAAKKSPVEMDVVAAEYFFDHDPGFGNGNFLDISFASDSIEQQIVLNGKGLEEGKHRVFFRVKNNFGQWSLTVNDSIYKTNQRFQSLSFPVLEEQLYGVKAFSTKAETSSGLPITYTSSDEDVAVVINDSIFVKSAGETFISAKQEGDSLYISTDSISHLLTVNKALLTITPDDHTRPYLQDNPELTVQFKGFVSGDSIEDIYHSSVYTTASYDSDVGEYPITIIEASADNYEIQIDTGVLTITKGTQEITFSMVDEVFYYEDSLLLEASTTSNLPVYFASNDSSIATIEGDVLYLHQPGNVVVTAYQDGNENYEEAISISLELLVKDIATSEPYLGSPFKIPGVIEAEYFNTGGQGVAYYDHDLENKGKALFRDDEGVDIYYLDNEGYAVGNTAQGEWLEYTVEVEESAVYKIDFYYASGEYSDEQVFMLTMDYDSLTPLVVFDHQYTYWNNSFDTLTRHAFMEKGIHKMRLVSLSVDYRMDHIIFTKTPYDNSSHVLGNVSILANRDSILETEIVSFTPSIQETGWEYEWEFDGGTPSYSTEKSPQITYKVEGEYDVRLIITTADIQGAITQSEMIKVAYNEGFIEYTEYSASNEMVYLSPEKYQLFSVPYKLNDPNIESFLEPSLGEYIPENWRMWEYQHQLKDDNVNSSFVELGKGLSDFEPGKGYWLGVNKDVLDLRIEGTYPDASSYDAGINIHLYPGWNLIGTPFYGLIYWKNVLARNFIPDDVNISPSLIKWNPEGGYYFEDDYLNAWEGAFVYVEKEITLKFHLLGNHYRLSESKGGKPFINDNTSWRLPFDVQSGNKKYALTKIGMSKGAKDGFDLYDLKVLPGFGSPFYVSVSNIDHMMLDDSEEQLTQNIVGNKDFEEWDLDFHVQEAMPIELRWDPHILAPLSKELYLFDSVIQELIDLKISNTYSFQRKNGSSSLKVFYGEKEEIIDALNTLTSKVKSVFPNPAGNNINILFQSNMEQPLIVEFFTLEGMKVKEVGKEVLKGVQVLNISLSGLPNGVYITRVIYGNTAQVYKVIRNE